MRNDKEAQMENAIAVENYLHASFDGNFGCCYALAVAGRILST